MVFVFMQKGDLNYQSSATNVARLLDGIALNCSLTSGKQRNRRAPFIPPRKHIGFILAE